MINRILQGMYVENNKKALVKNKDVYLKRLIDYYSEIYTYPNYKDLFKNISLKKLIESLKIGFEERFKFQMYLIEKKMVTPVEPINPVVCEYQLSSHCHFCGEKIPGLFFADAKIDERDWCYNCIKKSKHTTKEEKEFAIKKEKEYLIQKEKEKKMSEEAENNFIEKYGVSGVLLRNRLKAMLTVAASKNKEDFVLKSGDSNIFGEFKEGKKYEKIWSQSEIMRGFEEENRI